MSKDTPSSRMDGYSLLMKGLVATSVVGLAVAYRKVYLFHIVLGLTLLTTLFIAAKGSLRDRTPLGSSYHYFFSFFVGWFALGVLWTQHKTYTVIYVTYISIGSILAILVIKYIGKNPQRFEDLFKTARRWFLLDMGVGLLEATGKFRLPISLYSKSSAEFQEHLSELSDVSMQYIETAPTGFNWNPNNFAMAMNLMLPFFILHRSWWVRMGGVVCVVCLAISAGSRGSLATAGFIVLASAIFSYRNARMLWGASLSVALLAILLSGPLASLLESDSVGNKLQEAISTLGVLQEYFTESSSESGTSLDIRRRLLQNGWEAFVTTHGLGIGGGADKHVQENQGHHKGDVTSMHNYWVELLVNGGIPLITVMVIWYAMLILELYFLARHFPAGSPPRYYASCLSLALIGFIPGAVTASSAIYFLPQYLMYGFAIAMINVGRDRIRQAKNLPTHIDSQFPSPHRLIQERG